MCGQPICPTCRQPLTLIHGRYHCCNLECSAVVVLVENKETEVIGNIYEDPIQAPTPSQGDPTIKEDQ